MNHHDVPMPPHIAELPRDHRGYPVPHNVLWADGKPMFAANDVQVIQAAVKENRCHVCGQYLDPYSWFVGGPGSALLNGHQGVFVDGPMHQSCVEYALQVCPHLSHHLPVPLGPAMLPHLRKQGIAVVDRTSIPGVPPIFVAVQGHSFSFGSPRYFYVPRPYRKIAYWRDGMRLSVRDGEKAAHKACRELTASIEAGGTPVYAIKADK